MARRCCQRCSASSWQRPVVWSNGLCALSPRPGLLDAWVRPCDSGRAHRHRVPPACDRNTACAPTPHPLCRALPTPRSVRRSRHRALPARDRRPATLCLGDAPQPVIAPVGMRSPPSSPCPAPRCPHRTRHAPHPAAHAASASAMPRAPSPPAAPRPAARVPLRFRQFPRNGAVIQLPIQENFVSKDKQ